MSKVKKVVKDAVQQRYYPESAKDFQGPREHKAVEIAKVAGRVAKDATKVAGIITKFTQHPQWYTNYKVSGLVNLNFGLRKDMSVGNAAVPCVMGMHLGLYEPVDNQPGDINMPGNSEVYVDAGWKQGIERLYMSLRAANSSTSPYTLKQLDGYVLNVRAAHAAYATLRRLFACINNYSAYDGRLPQAFVQADGIDFEDLKDHLADLRMAGYNLGMKIAATLPLNMPIIDRTRWLFSNYFADSNDAKASYYVPTCTNTPITMFRDTAGGVYTDQKILYSATFVDNLSTYEQLMAGVDNIMKIIDDNPSTKAIAAEMLKAFGQSAIYKAETWDIKQPVPTLYDESALTQIQNAFTMNYGLRTSTSGFPVSQFEHTLDTATGSHYYVIDYPGTAEISNDYVRQKVYNDLTSVYLNFYKDTVSPGEALSAMRLCTSWHFGYTSSGMLRCKLVGTGTEVPLFMTVISGPTTKRILAFRTLDQIDELLDVATLDDRGYDTFAWSSFDWAPRVIWAYSLKGDDGVVDAGSLYNLWDWNNYAPAPSGRTYTSYNSIANLSLLFVPAINRQVQWNAINLD